jgi:alkylation response protein AidB-like acyl-CoA dehydrogenase
MFEWSHDQLAMRDAVRNFVKNEVAPIRTELEFGDLPPYALIRKFYETFGLDEMAIERFARQTGGDSSPNISDVDREQRISSTLIPMIELSRVSPGLVTAMGVSANLASASVMKLGSQEQKERWALDLLTFNKIGSWALTEPDSGSDAFGSMRSSARRDGDEFILNGSKTFITNGPFADTIVFICKLDEGLEKKRVLTFVLDRGMEGLSQSKPLRKMGLHSSPTGEVSLTDVRVGRDRLLAGTTEATRSAQSRTDDKAPARATFASERASIAAMALGIIEECVERSLEYARQRVQFGSRIGDFQLIQQKLAGMEVARINVQNQIFQYIERYSAGKGLSLAEASAMKLYSARSAAKVSQETVQLFGGNGYMSEFGVEQLARDAKALQIYAGTDEMQTIQIAKDMLRRSADS